MFDYLPLAATIDDVIFFVHGGIPRPIDSSSATRIEVINRIPAPYDLSPSSSSEQPELRQVVLDLLWSDPAQNQQEAHLDQHGFGTGERGPGAVCYGQKAVEEFVQYNGLSHILRAHEPTASGVSVRKGAKVITIFSTSRVGVRKTVHCRITTAKMRFVDASWSMEKTLLRLTIRMVLWVKVGNRGNRRRVERSAVPSSG